mgnify:CR=1 FL=1
MDYDDDVLTLRRRPLAYRIVLWLFVAFCATILIVSRTQPALAADLKGTHHASSNGSAATAGSGNQGSTSANDAGSAKGDNINGGSSAATTDTSSAAPAALTPAPVAASSSQKVDQSERAREILAEGVGR